MDVFVLLAALPATPEPQALTLGRLEQALILFGSVIILTASIGITRFPDFYTRLHASTKLVTLGGVSIFVGVALAFAEAAVTQRILLITVFFALTAPISAYMIARSGYLRGLEPHREAGSVDEWGEGLEPPGADH
ncbi:MAG: monovalent cation/H(+) antiporter subunit G [Trueperaceae bacterium]|nr:monovalent cation/H(+) antiporter subunit G [Trueperaceae bacterium]